MDENWMQPHVGTEIRIRPEFEDNLAELLRSEWRGVPNVQVDEHARSTDDHHRLRLVLAAAAAVVFVAVAVLITRSVSTTTPTISPPPETIANPTVPNSVPVQSSTDPPTTSVSPTPATQTADLVVPIDGGPDLQPTVLATLPVGQGPGQLTLQNGEFATPVALLADHIVVIEDVPFNGLTGRVLLLDRSGAWQRDTQIPELAGQSLRWLAAAPNGLLFVLTAQNNGPQLTLRSFSLTADQFEPVDAVAIATVINPALTIEPTGIFDGTTQVMTVDTGAVPSSVAISLDPTRTTNDLAAILLDDSSANAETWQLDVNFDQSTTAEQVTNRSGRARGFIWYLGNTSSNPANGGPFLAVLSDDRTATWARLGPWTFAAADNDLLLLTRVTNGGLVLATANDPTCTALGRIGLSLPTDSPWASGAFVSRCDYMNVNAVPDARLDVYDSASGGQVVAWWYYNCGLPVGVVAVGEQLPEDCGTQGSVAPPTVTS